MEYNSIVGYILQGLILAFLIFIASVFGAAFISITRKLTLMFIDHQAFMYAVVEVLATEQRKEFIDVYEKKREILKNDKNFTRTK